jgi:hypothetical protein
VALPTITFNDQTGSDTQASGSAPSAAVFGTKGSVSGSGANRIGFFEASPPDLSTVLTDGSSALWFNSASGRRFLKITAKKDTQESTTGNMSVGSAVVSSMGATAGMSAQDVIRIAGAGPASADLYADIVTVDSGTQVTVDQNASTAVTGAAVVCPKNVDSDASPLVGSVDRQWAIGGKRLTLDSAVPLWVDILPGWKVAFDWTDGGIGYTVAVAIALSVGGDTTTGRIKVYGVLGPDGQRPVIRQTGTANDIFIGNNVVLYTIEGIDFEVCDEAIRISGAATDWIIDNCRFNALDENDVLQPIVLSSSSASFRVLISRCQFASGTTRIADSTVGQLTSIIGCFFWGGTTAYSHTALTPTLIRDNVFDGCVTAINLGANATTTAHVIMGNVFEDVGGGITTGHVSQCRGMICVNNLFSQGASNCLNFSVGADHAVLIADYNGFETGTSNKYVNISAGAHDVEALPLSWNETIPGMPDRQIGGGVNFRGLGWPQLWGTGGGAPSILSPYNKITYDIGVQLAEPIGGNMLFRVLSVDDAGNYWSVGGIIIKSDGTSEGGHIAVTKADIPAAGFAHLGAAIANVQAYLRSQAGATLVRKEIAC